MAKTKSARVRVLVATRIEGVPYECGDVVDLPESLAKAFVAAGEVDAHPDAVAYALGEGAEVKAHDTGDDTADE